MMILISFLQGPPGPIGSLGHPGSPGVAVSRRGLLGGGHCGGPARTLALSVSVPQGPLGPKGSKGSPVSTSGSPGLPHFSSLLPSTVPEPLTYLHSFIYLVINHVFNRFYSTLTIVLYQI